jgi:polynucleotide 5'-hydroxyl-kinase GRC3/NOL9
LYGSDFDILTTLITRIKPHYAIHLGNKQSIDVDNATKLHSLQTVISQYRGSMHEIAAYIPSSTPMRSDAQLRTMQMSSYFHLKPPTSSPSPWLSTPLSSLVPWEFSYAETATRVQDFVGFATYSEPIPPASLLHALTGSIVQIVESTSSVIPSPYTAMPRTNKHRVPYFPESNCTGMIEPLDPKTSKLICTALVRGFDLERRIVQVLVPQAHDEDMYGLTPERTVLVGGCCDMPEWAYLEDACAAKMTARNGEEMGRIPWVEEMGRVEGMGYLNTVRRVRKFQT